MFVAHPEMFSLVFLDRTKHIKSICINKFHCVGCSSRKFDFHVGEISVQLNKYPILIECYSIDIDTKFFIVWSMWSNRMIRDFFFRFNGFFSKNSSQFIRSKYLATQNVCHICGKIFYCCQLDQMILLDSFHLVRIHFNRKTKGWTFVGNVTVVFFLVEFIE